MPRLAQVGITPGALQETPGRVLTRMHQLAQHYVEALLSAELDTNQLKWLRGLAETELEARSLRLESVAEQVGAYDGRRISRVLPHLSREEEHIRDTRSMMIE